MLKIRQPTSYQQGDNKSKMTLVMMMAMMMVMYKTDRFIKRVKEVKMNKKNKKIQTPTNRMRNDALGMPDRLTIFWTILAWVHKHENKHDKTHEDL